MLTLSRRGKERAIVLRGIVQIMPWPRVRLGKKTVSVSLGAEAIENPALPMLVQMIDTSIVRVHQHGACIIRNRKQSMGRSRGGLTSKIHAVVDGNGLPVRLVIAAGEAHDSRLVAKFLSCLKSGSMLLADGRALQLLGRAPAQLRERIPARRGHFVANSLHGSRRVHALFFS